MINIKFGVRKPNFKKSLKAKTTGRAKRALKSSVNPLYGKKGMGLVNNPKKAVYNKVYNKTTVSAIPKGYNTTNSSNSSTSRSNNANLNNIGENTVVKSIDIPFPFKVVFIVSLVFWILDKFTSKPSDLNFIQILVSFAFITFLIRRFKRKK